MPKFPENKNYKQPPLPMVEGTSIHKEGLEEDHVYESSRGTENA